MQVLRGGTVVDHSGARRVDVAFDESGVIVDVGADLAVSGDDIDVDGCWVTPGLVDLQVHFRTPGPGRAETLESGALGAALGGITACVMMPNTDPPIDSVEMVDEVRRRAAGLPCDLVASATITRGRAGEHLTDLAALAACGVRIFTDDGDAVADPRLMRGALEFSSRFSGVVIAQHAEDARLVAGGSMHEGPASRRLGRRGRPREAEDVIVARDLELARATDGRLHVLHLSSGRSADLIRSARASGVRVTAEVTPQHLVLTDDDVESLGTSGKMNPPIREASDRAALVEAIRDGTIDAIATDHAPHDCDAKSAPFESAPPGMLGVETSAAVVFTELVGNGVLSVERAVQLVSIVPARIAGLADHGGPIAVGRPANLAVIDPAARWTVDADRLASLSQNSPWNGRAMTAQVRHTVLRGAFTVRDGVPVWSPRPVTR